MSQSLAVDAADHSIASATGAAQQALAANPDRVGYRIQSSSVLWINDTGSNATNAYGTGSIKLAADTPYETRNFCSKNAVSVFAVTASAAITVTEFGPISPAADTPHGTGLIGNPAGYQG